MKFTQFKIHLILGIILLGCVQETHKKTILFQVDASSVNDLETLGIRGGISPLNWDNDILLEDPDGEGIFEISLDFQTAQNGVTFKFVKNGSDFELEGEGNRFLKIEYKPEQLKYETKYDIPAYSLSQY